jgi:hypothetical protein
MSKSRYTHNLLLCPFLFFLCAIGQQHPIQVPSSSWPIDDVSILLCTSKICSYFVLYIVFLYAF